MRKPQAFAILGATIILASCGSQDQAGSGDSSAQVGAQTSASGEAAPAARDPVVAEKVTLEVRDTEPFGAHLTDANGRAVYMFSRDETGSSACQDRCLQDWPPLLQKGVLNAGTGVDQKSIGTIVRDGGTRQVTYAGRPLYYYVAEMASNTARVQNIRSHDGEWYLVSPSGEPLRAVDER